MNLERISFSIAAVCWLIHLILLWGFQFIPSIDYPVWLFHSNVLRETLLGYNTFSECYRIILGPIPNGGFVLPTSILSMFLPIEIAGKVTVSIFILGLPLSMLYLLKSIGGHGRNWLFSILVLFSVNFLHGNFAFLIGTCILLFTIGFILNSTPHSPARGLFIVLLSVAVYLSHAICAIVLIAFLVLVLFQRKFPISTKVACALGGGIIIALALAYILAPQSDQNHELFRWGIVSRGRLRMILEGFIAGWVFPPYQFLFVRSAANLLLPVVVGFIFWYSLRTVRGQIKVSVLAQLVGVTIAISLFSPEMAWGIIEIPQRFTFILFLLLLPFLPTTQLLYRRLQILLIVAVLLTTWIRITDYSQASLMLNERHQFLKSSVPRHSSVLALDDGLQSAETPWHHFVPRRIHLGTQNHYLLFEGGCNPLGYETGYVSIRPDRYIPTWEFMARQAPENFISVRGGDVPSFISTIVVDAFSDWGDQLAEKLRPEFVVFTRTRNHLGMHTLVLERTHQD